MSSTPNSVNSASTAALEAVDEVVSRADERKRRSVERTTELANEATRRPFLGRGSTLASLVLLLPAVIAWNAYTLGGPPEPVPADVFEATARAHLAIVAEEVEAYIEDSGTVPESLATLGYEDDAIRLVRSGEEYELISEEVQPAIVYHGGTDPALLLESSLEGM